MSLFTAILAEVDRQAKEQGFDKLRVEAYQLNAAAKGATQIVEEFNRDAVRAKADMGLSAWLGSDDTGLSSMAMAYNLFQKGNVSRGCETRHPLDPADFGRCHRFLEAVPGARDLLPKMAEVSETWKRLVGAWDELTALYLEELPSGNAPKCYARMKELGC